MFSSPVHCSMQRATVEALLSLVEKVEQHTRRTHLRKFSMLPSLASMLESLAEASCSGRVLSILPPRTDLPACRLAELYGKSP